MTAITGRWNGLETEVERGTAVVADAPEFPLYWARTEGLLGRRIRVVRVVLDGVNFGGGTSYLDDREGQGWAKVTTGHGNPRLGHADVQIEPGSFEPTASVRSAPDLSADELATVDAFGLSGAPTPIADAQILAMLETALIHNDTLWDALPEYVAEYPVGTTNADVRPKWLPFHEALNGLLYGATVAALLIRIQKRDPAFAEELAEQVRDWTDAGDTYPELIWEWADARGLDPDKFVTDEKAKHEAWLAEPHPRAAQPAPAPAEGGETR